MWYDKSSWNSDATSLKFKVGVSCNLISFYDKCFICNHCSNTLLCSENSVFGQIIKQKHTQRTYLLAM